MKRLETSPEQCTGCRLCVLTCSFHHENAFSEALARLWVQADETRWRFEPIVCHQCPDSPCIEACPTGAISRDAVNGGLVLDEDGCVGCQTCVDSCPYQAIIYNENRDLVQLCDLCGGDPECVIACPHGAIQYTIEGVIRE